MFGVHQAGPERVLFDPFDDPAHDADGLQRIIAGRRLGREHQSIRTLIDCIGHIGGLGSRGRRRGGHGFQHLGRHDHRDAALARRADDHLLGDRHLFGVQLDAQVSTRDHHAVGVVHDRAELGQSLRLLDLGQAGRLAVHEPLQLGHVLGLLDEAESHPIHAHAQGEGQVFTVLCGQGRDRDHRLRHCDALAVAELRAAFDGDVGPFVGPIAHTQTDPAVVEQQQHARPQGLEDFGVRHLHPRLVAGRGIEIKPHPMSRLDRDFDVLETAQAKLGSLQVGEHAQRPLQGEFGPAHSLQRRCVVVMRSVAEVQPEDVDAGLGQGLDHARRPAGRSQGRNNTAASCSVHDGPVCRKRFPCPGCANQTRST